jgi:hypothetical protein
VNLQIVRPAGGLVNHLGLSESALDIAPPELQAVLMPVLEDRIKQVFAADGPAAFAMLKTDAAVHEAGHCAVASTEGMTVKRASIFEAPVSDAAAAIYGTVWAGRTVYSGRRWRIDADSDPIQDLRCARTMVAGLGAEHVCGIARAGSSLDELIMAQIMVDMAAKKFGVTGPELWGKTWLGTVEICWRNRKTIEAVADRLMKTGSITGTPLRRLLDGVEP